MTPNAGVLEVIEQGADMVPSPAFPPLDQVREYIRASKAENTLRGYQSDWRAFCAWTDALDSAQCPQARRPWRHSSPSAPGG